MRVVARPGGSLEVGRSLAGRGAWLCATSAACIDLAEGRKAFARALRADVSTTAIDRLRTTMVERGTLGS